jgi:hypothetical protein
MVLLLLLLLLLLLQGCQEAAVLPVCVH